jgi:hypothetical protein
MYECVQEKEQNRTRNYILHMPCTAMPKNIVSAVWLCIVLICI